MQLRSDSFGINGPSRAARKLVPRRHRTTGDDADIALFVDRLCISLLLVRRLLRGSHDRCRLLGIEGAVKQITMPINLTAEIIHRPADLAKVRKRTSYFFEV